MTHPRSLAGLAHARFARFAVLGVAGLVACPEDDAPSHGEAGSSTGASSTGSSTATGSTSEESSSSTAVDSTGEGSSESDTTTGPPPVQVCIGYTIAAYVGYVLTREGASDDPPRCDPAPSACGGELVGVWSLETTCGYEAAPNPIGDGCPESSYAVEILAQGGTLTVAADSTFAQDFALVSEATVELDPLDCFGLTCEEFQPYAGETATCSTEGALCHCTVPADTSGDPPVSGTWAIEGTDFVLAINGARVVRPFCVENDHVTIWQPIALSPEVTDVECLTRTDCVDALGDAFVDYLCGIAP